MPPFCLLFAVGSQIYRRLSGIFLHSEHTGLRNVGVRRVGTVQALQSAVR